jgi:hypothetical protein
MVTRHDMNSSGAPVLLALRADPAPVDPVEAIAARLRQVEAEVGRLNDGISGLNALIARQDKAIALRDRIIEDMRERHSSTTDRLRSANRMAANVIRSLRADLASFAPDAKLLPNDGGAVDASATEYRDLGHVVMDAGAGLLPPNDDSAAPSPLYCVNFATGEVKVEDSNGRWHSVEARVDPAEAGADQTAAAVVFGLSPVGSDPFTREYLAALDDEIKRWQEIVDKRAAPAVDHLVTHDGQPYGAALWRLPVED